MEEELDLTKSNWVQENEIYISAIKESIEEMRKLMLSLKVIGVFDIFIPQEWLNIQDSKQWGRVTCVLLYLEKYPDIINSEIKSRIKAIEKASPPLVITNIINELKKHLN